MITKAQWQALNDQQQWDYFTVCGMTVDQADEQITLMRELLADKPMPPILLVSSHQQPHRYLIVYDIEALPELPLNGH